MNPKLGKSPSAVENSGKCGGRAGGTHFFACANVLVSLSPSDYQENCHECSNHENGVGGLAFLFFKSGVSWVMMVFKRGFDCRRDM